MPFLILALIGVIALAVLTTHWVVGLIIGVMALLFIGMLS